MFRLSILSLFVVAAVSTSLALTVATSSNGERDIHSYDVDVALLPLPKEFTHGKQKLQLVTKGSFEFTTDSTSHIVRNNIARYLETIYKAPRPRYLPDDPAPPAADGFIKEVKITIEDESVEIIGLDTDESYSLEIPSASGNAVVGTLNAKTVFGAIRGLETFSQLVHRVHTNPSSDGDCDNEYQVWGAPWKITDKPRFPHRGVLIDTSRHFYPVDDILRTIDALSYNKMNVLHWHIVDSQSFPLEIKAFPKLSSKGAYSSWERYTQDDIKHIVKYANERGVRVIPEYDGPGHTYAWGLGYPDLTVCPNAMPWGTYCAEPPCGQFNPLNEQVYKVMEAVINESSDMFLDDFIHLGADEVNYNCWGTSKEITEWLNAHNATGEYAKLFQMYESKVHKLAHNKGKLVINWEEVFNENLSLDKDRTVVQVWLDHAKLNEVLRAGYKAVLSDYQNWYLDCGTGNWLTGRTSWCDPFKTWQTMYENEPLSNVTGLTPEQQKNVLGGEACLWSEQADGHNIDQAMWPRASAVAERLWSPKHVNDIDDALTRMRLNRARLIARGIQATPLQPTYCGMDPDTRACYGSSNGRRLHRQEVAENGVEFLIHEEPLNEYHPTRRPHNHEGTNLHHTVSDSYIDFDEI